MNEEQELKQAEEVAQSMTGNTHLDIRLQANQLYSSTVEDKKSLSQYQFEDAGDVLTQIQGE